MSPALLLSLVCFGIPALFMARMSLNGHEPMTVYVSGFTFEHYRRLLSDPLITKVIWNTAWLAFATSIVTVALAYAFALLVWLRPGRWRMMFIGIALLPMLISEIAIIFGWWTIFPRNGLLSYVLISVGITRDKVSLMYTEGAALVGLVYATPLALGPDTLWTLGYLIQDQMLGKHHWPMAATLSMALMLGVAGVMIVVRWLQPAQRSFHV